MTVYTLFGQSGAPAAVTADATAYTMGTQFTISQTAALTGIWFNSAVGALELPSATAVYLMTGAGTGTIVAGTQNNSPSWSGAAASGWVKVTYDGSTNLTSGNTYKVVVLGGTGGNVWYSSTAHYWDSGAGSGGIVSGIITAPSNAGGDQGQSTFHAASALNYPDSSFNASNYWPDVELTVSGAAVTASAALAAVPGFTAATTQALVTTAALAVSPGFIARGFNPADVPPLAPSAGGDDPGRSPVRKLEWLGM